MKLDAFALLGLPRRASLTADEVRAAFQRAGAALHPDCAGNAAADRMDSADFAAVNEARATLTSPHRRLRHLLELEYPESASVSAGAVMDSAMMDLFAAVGAAVQAAASVQSRKKSAATALAKAMMAADAMKAQESVESAAAQVDSARAVLEAELAELDAARASGDHVAARLQACAARAGFLEKWQAQLRAALAGFFDA
jgi:curved DNA-binding protein CbpA